MERDHNGERGYDPRPALARLEAQMEGRRVYLDQLLQERDRQYQLRFDMLNELRAEVIAERGRFVTREMYDTRHETLQRDLAERWEANAQAVERARKESGEEMERARREINAELGSIRGELGVLKDFRSRVLGLALLLSIFAGVVGALIIHLATGN